MRVSSRLTTPDATTIVPANGRKATPALSAL
jgi:hypothetical protein